MKIAARPLEAVLAKMASKFNDNLASVSMSTYGVKPFAIKFPNSIYDAATDNFIMGQIAPDDIDAFGASNATKITLFALQSLNRNYEKPRDFSGDVSVGLDFHLCWLTTNIKQNLVAPALAVEAAVGLTLQAYNDQSWGPGVVYNGLYSCVHGAVVVPESGKTGFRQTLAFRFNFNVDV